MDNRKINSIKEVYSSDFVKIEEGPVQGIFRILFAHSNRILINSLLKTKLIHCGTSTDDYRVLQFKASSVKPLNQFQEEFKLKTGSNSLPINIAAHITNALVDQLNYLLTHEDRTIIGYNPENVIVINDNKFAFLGSEMVTEIKDNMCQISYPFTQTDFYVSPELLNIKELPSYVHYKTAYFSLACLIVNVLLADDDYYNEYLRYGKSANIIEYLNKHHIVNTKLYWLLSRCLIDDPTKRRILLL